MITSSIVCSFRSAGSGDPEPPQGRGNGERCRKVNGEQKANLAKHLVRRGMIASG
jgi:hypothetical protein